MNGLLKKGKIIREELFPFLVLNGFDTLGIILWIDYGHYFKCILKSEYENQRKISQSYPD